LKDDLLEALERRTVALNLHAQDGALPRRQQEVGEFAGRKVGSDFAGRLGVRNAGGEGHAPLREDRDKLRAQGLAAAGSLQAEIADQATATPGIAFELAGD